MSAYEAHELGVGEQRTVSFPASAEKGANLFAPYPDVDETVSVEMDQSVNTELYAFGGDGNPIHYDPDFVQAYDEVMPFFDGFPDGALIVQGSAFIYEAVKNSNKPVKYVSSRFENAVDTTDVVEIERERTDNGELINVYLDDGDRASTHELTYDKEQIGADDETVELLNTAKAEKIPKAVGADDQLNNLLLGVEAELGDGYGEDIITHVKEGDGPEDTPINREDEFTYTDGTAVTLYLLEPDQELQDAVMETYKERKADQTITNPFLRVATANIEASSKAFQAMMEGRPYDAWSDATQTWFDTAIES